MKTPGYLVLGLALSGPARGVAQTAGGGAAPPQATISNGLVHIRFYLPDTAAGYYRGTRFDWSGVMPDLDYNGHHYSGQWFKTYAPTTHDALMGPVESFGPLGYGQGGRFIAIGIGTLKQIDDKPYNPFRYYPILDPGTWRIKRYKDRIVFTQKLEKAYLYTKTIRLLKGKAQFVITHTLRNTSDKPIETDVYDHNLFPIDQQPTGPGLILSFPFRLAAAQQRGNSARIDDSSIVFDRTLVGKEDAYAVLSGYGNDSKDYDIRIVNHRTGAGMRITGDRPLSRLVFWASATTACPEAYIHIKIEPGASFSWSISYQLYDEKKSTAGSAVAKRLHT